MSTVDYKITNFLNELGLTDTEQQLYLCGLESAEASVGWLVEKTGINRTTAYHALGTLKQKGFCTEARQQGRLVYTMTSASDLAHTLSLREVQLERQKQQLTELSHLFPVSPAENLGDTHVEKYQGLEGIKQAVEKALYCRSRQWKIIAPKDNFFSQVDADYSHYFMQTRRERQIKARTLWEKDPAVTPNLSLEDLLMRKPRYLAPEFSKQFKSVVILFDNKALFITSHSRQTAVIVESEEIVGTLSVLFENLWLLAEHPLAH
ncbi:MAG: transcriptional regulator TrmB [Candidatus Saccharibacteria bacterium]|nr:transcriptional regulator TrmB [Candidatus Saccharibacteria bacterium]